MRRDMEGMSCICAHSIIIMHLALLFLNDSCIPSLTVYLRVLKQRLVFVYNSVVTSVGMMKRPAPRPVLRSLCVVCDLFVNIVSSCLS